MAGSQGLFTLKEAAYLRSLPAVKEVSATRITYSDRFKVECVRRYLKGESARKIFRDAGLDPSLIGAKRIERCIARWKQDEQLMAEGSMPTPVAKMASMPPPPGRWGASMRNPCLIATTSPTRRSRRSAPANPVAKCSTCAT